MRRHRLQSQADSDDSSSSVFRRQDREAGAPPGAWDIATSRQAGYDAEQNHVERGRSLRRANSLSKLFGQTRHSHHELRAKKPLAPGNATRSATQRGGDWHDDPLSLDTDSASAAGGGGLFSREARQRRKRAGSAPASTLDRPASTPPPLARRPEPEVPLAFSCRDAPPTSGLTRSAPSTARATPEPLLAPTEDSAAARTTPDPDPELDHPLFKPAFSLRQLKRLQRAAHRVERHDRKQLKKGTIGAEVKVAMGVLEYIEIERRNKQKLHGKSAGPGRGHGRRRGSEAGAGGGAGRDGLAGLVQDLESQVEHRLEAVRGEGTPTPTPVSATEEPRGRERDAGADTGRVTRNQVLAGVGGAAAVVGLVGAAGYEWWQHRHGHEPRGGTSRRGRDQRDTRTSEHADLPARRDLSVNRPKAAAAIAPSATVDSIPRPLADPSPHPPPTPYLSTLTPAQHHLVQHAAAALLLKQRHEHEGVHDKLHRAIGGFEHMVRTLEAGVQSAWRGVHDHAPSVTGQGTRPSQLFGTPLGYLAKHEGIDSFHGADPHGTVRIPEFLDHCITAMMQADVTVEGILRKNGKVRIVREIMHALDNSGGDDTVIDLAALDPVTLADLFKQFLGALPDPVMTGHLFKLFIACSHISHVGIRRRCMHLVICMMPKVNRDVLEVVFLFLEWLSRFAHVTVKDGNRMDLTSIATVMAPTLLRPGHRDPKPFEVRPMIAAVLSLLEDQHLLHAVPPELARVLHLEVPRDHPHGPASGLQGGAALLHTLAKVL